MAARKMKKTVDVEAGTLTIEIAGKSKVYDVNALNDYIKMRGLLHGISQKLGDSCAGNEPSFILIDSVFAQISGEDGTWSVRKPKAKTVPEAAMLKALMDSGMSEEDAKALMAKAV